MNHHAKGTTPIVEIVTFFMDVIVQIKFHQQEIIRLTRTYKIYILRLKMSF